MTNHTAALQQHTSGPWLAREYVSGNWEVADDLSGAKLAGVAGAANARLMAAAPELLESLRELHDWMREHATVSESLEMLTRSHAVIAKATHG